MLPAFASPLWGPVDQMQRTFTLPGLWRNVQATPNVGEGPGHDVWLVCSCTTVLTWGLRKRFRYSAKHSRPRVCCRNTRPSIQLLIDGDTHSLDEIEWALRKLASEGETVKATLFANPKRLNNRRWSRFVRDQGLHFKGVERVAGYTDPSDEAILKYLTNLAGAPGVVPIALLTSDSDFLPLLSEISRAGTEVTVFVPEWKRPVLRRYTEAGLVVRPVASSNSTTYRVSAHLHQDGTGAVRRCKPIQRMYVDEEAALLRPFLGKMGGWIESELNFLTCAVKFWFANSMGTLTVFPHQCAISELSRAVTQNPSKWLCPSQSLAYLFPLRTGGNNGKQTNMLGGILAWKVAKSTGPFMLHDSEALTFRALRKLGYIRTRHKTDFSEAMFVFANLSGNKRLLRDTGNLPGQTDTDSQVSTKLRKAFLSSVTNGHWQPPPKDSQVRKLLVREGYLQAVGDSRPSVLAAMRRRSSEQGLPAMKTYLGYVWQILQEINAADPSRREVVGR